MADADMGVGDELNIEELLVVVEGKDERGVRPSAPVPVGRAGDRGGRAGVELVVGKGSCRGGKVGEGSPYELTGDIGTEAPPPLDQAE